jgi:2-amino-4-hydroxy-6-hydroxymethyldihydropteridine diphosphokinase
MSPESQARSKAEAERLAVADPDIPALVADLMMFASSLEAEGFSETPKIMRNAAAALSTSLAPLDLLDRLLAIEQANGRVRRERWGPRTLDIDIIAYDRIDLKTEDLTIPHPRAHERAFVLVPWSLMQPDAELPGRGRVADLAKPIAEEVWLA